MSVREQPRVALRHLWTWLQAAGLVYLIGIGLMLVVGAIALPVLALFTLVSWAAGLMR